MGTLHEDYDDGGDGHAAHLGSARATRELVPAAAAAPATPAPFNRQQIELIKQTIAAGASDLELDFFLEVCRLTGLNPFQRQIYAIMRNVREGERWVKRMTIQTGIDGYRLIAARTGQLAGIDDARFDTEAEDHPNRATVTVWRFVAGQRVPFTATARWREYAQATKDGKLTGKWGDMPYLMLGKCAEALALRKAFPAELSGVYTHEEMAQADDGDDGLAPAPERTTRHTRAECSRYAHEHGLSLAAYQRAAAKYADDDALWDALHDGVRILEEKRLAQQAHEAAVTVTVTEADPTPEPEPEPDEPPSETKTTKPYSMLGDVELRARADRIGYKTVDAIEMLLAKAGLTVETAMRAECEAALHAEEVRAAAVLGPTNPVGAGAGKSGAKGGAR